MTRLQKLNGILIAVIMIITAGIMLYYPDNSYYFIITFLSLGYAIMGIRLLIFYFTMAKNMVGGKINLYKGVILLDFGIFTCSISDVPKHYIMLYLVATHAFTGLVELLRANEARQYGANAWKFKAFHGLLNMSMALICLIFSSNIRTMVYIYCLGLIYSALLRIISSLRKTTMIYIQ